MLELKGSTLPPWVVWRVSAVMQKFHSGNLEARYDILLLCSADNLHIHPKYWSYMSFAIISLENHR
jgi:hypothetical protein